MGNPLDRPGRSDRRAAVRRIKDAVRAGVIVQADADLRIQQVQSAGSNADVQAQLTDLTARAAQASVVSAATGTPAAPVQQPNPYGPVSPRLTASATGRRVVTAVATVPRRRILPLAVGAVIALSVANGVVGGVLDAVLPGSSTADAGSGPSTTVDMFTADAVNRLRAELLVETGSTDVTRVVMYPSYASVEAPTRGGLTLYSWRGDLQKLTTTDADPTAAAVDFSDYRPEVLISLVDQAKTLLAAPATWYVIVQPALLDDGATIYAYANESGGQGVYISATQDGTLVRTQRF